MRMALIAACLGLSAIPAAAQIDCAKSPTYMRKIPGGTEIAFHPGCEPPPVAPREPARPERKATIQKPSCPTCEAYNRAISKMQYESFAGRYNAASARRARLDALRRR